MTSHDMSFHFMPLIMFMSISISISVSPIPAIYNISITLSFSQMTEREKVMKKTFFSTIGSIFWVLLLFIFTYAVIRLLPKPT